MKLLGDLSETFPQILHETFRMYVNIFKRGSGAEL
jgi:hypothetical protein